MHDFVTFLQLFVIFMISSGVAITAVLYPHHPLGLDLFGKAFVFRGLMALFSSEMRDFKSQRRSCSINGTGFNDSEHTCLRLSNGLSFNCRLFFSFSNLILFVVLKMIIFMPTIDMVYPHHDAIKHLGLLGFYSYNISSWPNVFSLHFSQQCLGMFRDHKKMFMGDSFALV